MRIARFPVNGGKNVLRRFVSTGNYADGEGTGYLRCGYVRSHCNCPTCTSALLTFDCSNNLILFVFTSDMRACDTCLHLIVQEL